MSLFRRVLPALACAFTFVALAGPATALDPDHLPGNTEVVLHINFRQIFGSNLAKTNQGLVDQLKQMVASKLTEEGVQSYLEKIDFDLFRDLGTITVASSGGKIPDFILLEGKFNPEKINATGEDASKDNADHIKPIKLGGQPAYEIRKAPDEMAVYAGVIGKDKMVVTSSKEAFTQAVARMASGAKKSSNLKKELRDILAAESTTRSFSLATTGPALAKMLDDAPVPNIEALQGILQGVSALNIAIAIEKNINFELAVNSKDKESAEQMAKLAGVGLAAAKMMLKKRAEAEPKYVPALDVVTAMRVTSMGSNFVLRGEITAETLGKVLKDLPK